MTEPSPRATADRTTGPAPRAVGGFLAGAAVVLLAVNLRFVFGSASAVQADVRSAYDLGPASVGLLTTGPVVCLGAFAPVAARAVRRWTVPTALAAALLLVTAGTLLRGVPVWSVLLLATLVAGIGIAVGNVLGPVFLRLFFAHRIGLMTGLFTALINVSTGIASGATVPLATGVLHSWRAALVAWAAPAALAAVALGAVAVGHRRFQHARTGPVPDGPRWQPEVLRSPTAWAVTGFMGLQSLLAYSLVAWLPSLYRDRGLSPAHAGLVLTALSVASILTALTVPVLAVRLRRQRGLAVAVVALSVVGLLGALTGGTATAVLWAVVLGFGQGGELALALMLINLRASDSSASTSLSTMAQTVGYLIAAAGPVVTGVVHGLSGAWTAPLLTLIALMVPLAACGWFAGGNSAVRTAARTPVRTAPGE